MKIYLDNCCLQRPLDDKSQLRIQLESEAILAVLGLCERGTVNIVSSEVLELELDQNPNPQRKAFVEEIIAQAAGFVEVDSGITERAKELEGAGFKAMDALHLACAEAEQVDFFCSCDDRLLRKAKGLSTLTVRIVSPLELAEEIIR
jgi:predicted nucleic acid-binding protein